MEYILYHDKCQDGLLSAATFKKCGIGDKFIGCRYGDPFPIPVDTLTKDDDVYIVDFSFSRETLLEIKGLVGNVVVLDHHATAEKELMGLAFAKFEKDKCGAVMSWEFLHPDAPLPELYVLVDEYDRWEKTDDRADILNYGVGASVWWPDIDGWVKLIDEYEEIGPAVFHTGTIIKEQIDGICKGFGPKSKSVKVVNFNIGDLGPNAETSNGLYVAIANATEYPNEVAQAIYTAEGWDSPTGKVDFVILYHFDNKGNIKLNLRGEKGNCPDVGTIAKVLYGGGGHESSAGARLIGSDAIDWLSAIYNY